MPSPVDALASIRRPVPRRSCSKGSPRDRPVGHRPDRPGRSQASPGLLPRARPLRPPAGRRVADSTASSATPRPSWSSRSSPGRPGRMTSNRKAELYREAEVAEIWFVDDRDKVLIVHRGRTTVTRSSGSSPGPLHCQAFPGFWFDVSWLWAEPRARTSIACLEADPRRPAGLSVGRPMTPFAELLRRAWPVFLEAVRMRRTLTYSELAGRVGPALDGPGGPSPVAQPALGPMPALGPARPAGPGRPQGVRHAGRGLVRPGRARRPARRLGRGRRPLLRPSLAEDARPAAPGRPRRTWLNPAEFGERSRDRTCVSSCIAFSTRQIAS